MPLANHDPADSWKQDSSEHTPEYLLGKSSNEW